jgi:cytochrome c biogenesis DsbD-like protein
MGKMKRKKLKNNVGGRRGAALFVLSLAIIFSTSCKRNESGISSGTGGIPQLPATPAQVSSSADVVRVTTYSVQTAAGNSTSAVVRLAISSGYHVHANPATYPYLIATEVKAGTADGITAEKPTYPAAIKQKFEFAEEPLAVYEGMVDIELPLKIGSAVHAGPRSLPVSVRVQACDNEKCFPPVTLDAKILIEVK